jgi:hypothetical protein
MKAQSKVLRLLLGAVILGMLAIMGVSSALAGPPTSSSGGTGGVVYNAIPSKLPGSVPSQGFECCQTNEFGDEVGLGGTARTLKSMSVVLVSWGCESGRWYNNDCLTTSGATFNVPLTFTIYADNSGAPGAVLAQQTQTVAVPYRPSADSRCTGADAGKWYYLKDHACYNGFAQTIKMTFSGVGATLPSQVIWSAAYNTTHAGYSPIGEAAPCFTSSGGCGYDSLNVGAWSAPNAPYAGTDINEDEAFRNGAMEPGWTDYRPLGAIGAKK